MGRLPKNRTYKSIQSDAYVLKSRHRKADTKYRSNVQYLYSKLQELSQSKAAKDSLLNDTLSHIQALENEIIGKVGSDEMKNYQNEFTNFLLHEEALWKIKDTVKWWRKVEEALNAHDFIHNEEKDFASSSRLNSLKKTAISNTEFSQTSCCDATMATCIPTSQTFDGFCGRSSKNEKDLLEHSCNSFENNNILPCFSKFKESIFPCEGDSNSSIYFEEQSCFSNEISTDPVQFENFFS